MNLQTFNLAFHAAAARVISPASTEVARAQVVALKQRVPYLYGIVAINVLVLCCTQYETHSTWQVVVLPGGLILIMLSRMIWWVRLPAATLPDADIERVRWRTIKWSGVLGLFIFAWAISLQQTGTAAPLSSFMTERGHADFFVGVTIVSCIFLLMHLREAALLLALTVVAPFATYLLMTGRMIESAIALNLLLVTAAMLYVAVSFSRDFERMVTTSSELQSLSAKNAEIAVSDPLTHLPNRRHFFREFEKTNEREQVFAIIIVDLDGFKQVNDAYGHNAGDAVLCAVAARLQKHTPADACLARLGGDEFACLLAGDQAENATTIAAALISTCSKPLVFPAFTANLGASAGICLSRYHPDDPTGVYERADYALFEAKRAGRGRILSFSTEHEQSLHRDSSIARLLNLPKLENELSANFQPLVDAKTNAITSFEALLRWTSPVLGSVSPGEFIPVSERTDLIFRFSDFILRTALKEVAIWPANITVKVNLSIRDLMSKSQCEALLAVLLCSPVNPERVTFEVTETIFAKSLDVVKSNVAILRSSGCKIAIDDFGVGYSSLSYIYALTPDTIKIDRCFVERVACDDVSQRIIRTIVEMARNVGAKTVAEGIETAAQARLLAELGCDELQGFYFSKPVSGPAAAAMVIRPASGIRQVDRSRLRKALLPL